MIDYKMFFDAKGWPPAKFAESHDILSLYLEGDIQGSAKGCDRALESASEVERGIQPKIERIGNSCCVTLERDEVVIEDLFDETWRCKITMKEFQEIVLAWKDLVKVIKNR